MNPFLSLMRPSVCTLSALGIIVGGIVSGSILSLLIIPAIIAAFLITGAGNVINDYYDYKIDKINSPRRPIPSGKVKRGRAVCYFFLLVFIGLGLAFYVSIPFFAIALLNAFLLFVYSWRLKPIALIGNVIVSWLAASTFIAASLVITDFYTIPLSILILASIAFLGSLSREILLDVKDVKGDKKMGAKTLPIIIGAKPSQAIGYVILLVAAASLAMPILFEMFSIFYYIGALPAILLCLYSVFSHKNINKSQKLVKYAMYFVMLGFILGALI